MRTRRAAPKTKPLVTVIPYRRGVCDSGNRVNSYHFLYTFLYIGGWSRSSRRANALRRDIPLYKDGLVTSNTMGVLKPKISVV